MRVLARLSSMAVPQPMRAATPFQEYQRAFWAGDDVSTPWLSSVSAAGITITPELAMNLSAFYSGVTLIAHDLATLPAQVFKRREDEGKDRVRPIFGRGIDSSNGIGSLAYMLRWQPNGYQTAVEFFVAMVAQYLMRAKAYAEIIAGPTGFLEQLLPRHPDRIRVERLPSGRLRYRLTETTGGPRYLTQDEMLVVRDPVDGSADPVSRVQYGANAIGTCLAAEQAAGRFFQSGMTAALLATHPGEMEDDEKKNLHADLTRYATGVSNSFGLMLVPDDIKVTNLAIEPEKAQMMLAREMGVREIARILRIPGYKLGIKDTQTYASQVQSAVEYVISCLRPIAVAFEQSIQRDLILAKDTYFVEFLLEALLRGDPDARASYYERAIRSRWMRPSEVRLRENLNPDPELDRLSAADFRPGTAAPGAAGAAGERTSDEEPRRASLTGRAQVAAWLAVHDNAVRCLRRERAAVSKLAVKHAGDVEGWQASLRDFYGEHAGFVAQVMRLDPTIARGYAAQHGSTMETQGAAVLLDDQAYSDFERFEADELCALALDGQRVAA